ncbi:type II toxin-antitoxin system RelE family toxin [Enterobacteriaceae bacterium TYF_5]
MELLFQETKSFEKDLRKLPEKLKEKVINSINEQSLSFVENQVANSQKIKRLAQSNHHLDSDSSLYELKVDLNTRIILSIDDDPLFDQVIFTLYRIVSPKDFKVALKNISESLYQRSKN